MKRNQKTMTRHPTAVVEPIKFLAMISKGSTAILYVCDKEETTQDGRLCHCSCHIYNNWQQQHNRKFVFHKAHSTSIHVGLLVCCRVCVCMCTYKNLENKKARHVINADCPQSVMHEMSNPRLVLSFSLHTLRSQWLGFLFG